MGNKSIALVFGALMVLIGCHTSTRALTQSGISIALDKSGCVKEMLCYAKVTITNNFDVPVYFPKTKNHLGDEVVLEGYFRYEIFGEENKNWIPVDNDISETALIGGYAEVLPRSSVVLKVFLPERLYLSNCVRLFVRDKNGTEYSSQLGDCFEARSQNTAKPAFKRHASNL